MADYYSNKARMDKFKAEGLCYFCGKRQPVHGLNYCQECREKNNAHSKARRERLLAQGLCPRCGWDRPNGWKYQICPKCMERQKKKREEKNA